METIERAAISYGGVVYSVPRPGRHHNVIRLMVEESGLGPDCMHCQGFITSFGRFVDRYEAVKIASNAGQIKYKTFPLTQLFSEDVW